MSEDSFVLLINLSKLVAVNEYLRECGNEEVCVVLDGVIDGFKTVLSNLRQK